MRLQRYRCNSLKSVLGWRGRQQHGSQLHRCESRWNYQHRRLLIPLYVHISYQSRPLSFPSNQPPLVTGTGTQPTGVACKSISTQISEFLAAIDDNKIPVNYLWLDIEPEDASQPNVPCNSFQLGAAGNEALAKEWVAAIKATGRKWGIYANA